MSLCIVDYYCKFSVVKKVDSLAMDYLVQKAKIRFGEYGVPKQIILDTGMNFTSDIHTTLQADEHAVGHNIILLSPEQWSGGSMYKICEMHCQKQEG